MSIVFAGEAFAGAKVNVADGDFSMFATPQLVQVQFTYDDMMVGPSTEVDYIAERTADKNEKEAGSGDAWAEAWKSDREGRFHDKFIELMNKGMEGKAIFGTNADNPTYVMVVDVTRTEPGFFSYAVNKPAELDLDIKIAAAADPGTVLAHATVLRAPGTTATTFTMADTGSRIAEAYAKSGKELSKLMMKKLN